MLPRPAALLLAAATALAACGGSAPDPAETPAVADAPVQTPTAPPPANPADDPQLIAAKAYDGIIIAGPFADVRDRLTESTLETGDGPTTVYYLTDSSGERTAYVIIGDDEAVRSITITSPDAHTTEGIRVGSTLADLRAYFTELEVHGSEAEGRVYAEGGGLAYRLDAVSNEEDLDAAALAPDTRVTEIVVQ